MYDKIEFFKSYFSRATEKKILVESIGTRLNLLEDKAKILDLGCHDGSLIRTIITRYQHCISNKLNIVGVDPSQRALAEFSAHECSKKYSIKTYKGTAEEYFSRHNEYFDWILASQSLYWSPDLELIIRQIYQNSDSALIVLRGKKGIFEIQTQFKEYLGNKQEQLYSADDVERALVAEQIPYTKECHQTFIELPQQNTLEFNWLIAFFLQLEDADTPSDLISRVKDYIEQQSTANSLQHDVVFFWLGQTAC
ncbi:class I SAM-dependent methyltransferase [Legionella bononiensis]|uniref:Class I SAM-dependent methyltransferase n=1 Tax=Legionella bononiensis TaxID=2793102 RepID=A0ABS1WB43_9GAMM|nr:class I SAM-dependent methyltransferase [Legionella bononiensis]MBL7480194.1 class I SAM-dependent methyltransferase [Legionella bononiensis]MBL7526574.1 class I SAM-dependent methyltransferase [Legionella bononiensis]MBL7562932.1 class I SAM-dependent methyltransferase [Legionella bononiensis]